MDKKEALAKAKIFSDLLLDDFKPTKIFLYGSYADGNWNSDSDIDIAVVVKSLNQDYLKSLNLLYKLRRRVDIIIEPSLFIEGKDPSGILEYIQNNGELIYSEN